MANDEAIAVQDVLTISTVECVDGPCNAGQFLLFFGYRYTLKDAVVTTANCAGLVLRKMRILGYDYQVNIHIASDPVNCVLNLLPEQGRGSLNDCVAHTMTNQNLNGNLGVGFRFVGQVNDRARDSVRHLIRVAGIYFFKHIGPPNV